MWTTSRRGSSTCSCTAKRAFQRKTAARCGDGCCGNRVRSSGVLDFWSSGVREFRSSGGLKAARDHARNRFKGIVYMRAFALMAAAAAVTSGVVLLAGGQQPAAAPFTAAQATAGNTAYQANCAVCHAADLSGGGGPTLSGSFAGGWANRTTRDLISLMQNTMPPNGPGALPEPDYVNIAAYILQFNGATPGTQAMTAQTSVQIGTFLRPGGAQTAAPGAGGRGAVAAGQAPGAQPPAGGAGQRGAGAGAAGGQRG